MNNNIKVTFVMMAYNAEKFIEKAVRSVLNQTVSEVVLCVRNNGSTDGTGEILQRLANEDNRVIVTTNKINGIADDDVAFFTPEWWGLSEELTGEYVSILDADDYLEPNFVEKLYEAAKENNADITACGNWFFSEKAEKYSSRVPDAIVTDNMEELKDIFQSVYNCFRTWWGKLYKSEFFLGNFYQAWRWHHPLHWCIDTLIMVDYLSMCKKLVTIAEPLYNMYIRDDSTYTTRSVDYGILWGAYAIYNNNKEFLCRNNIDTEENVEFIEKLHWQYIIEGMTGMKNNPNMSVYSKLKFIKAVLNDSIVRSYLPKMFERIYGQLEPYLAEIEMQAGEDAGIYESYIMRLKCFVDSVEQDDTNPLNYPLLLGAVFDSENRNWFGMKFLDLPLRGGSQGIKGYLEMKEEAWMYWSEDIQSYFEVYYNNRDNTPEVIQATTEMAKCWEIGDYENCYDLVEEVSIKANLNREAMYYRLLLLEHFSQHDVALILAYTARVIFNYDKEMLDLCNNIIAGRQ